MNKPDFDERSLQWEEVSARHIVQNEWVDFRESTWKLPDGTVFSPFYCYTRRDYVVIVASDEAGNYICVRQFRPGIGEVTTEFPAGGLEASDQAGQQARLKSAWQAAQRELREETGYEAEKWRHLLTIPANATICDNYAFIFEARNCRKVADLQLDETEFLQVVRHTGEEIEQLIATGKFQQCVHVMAWLLAKNKAGLPFQEGEEA